MDVFTVSFFGHRDFIYTKSLEEKFQRLLKNIISEHEYVEFLVGRNGEFDTLAASAVRRAKKEYRSDNSSLCLVLPYMTAEYGNNEQSFLSYYDEVELCEESAKAHFKSAIGIRNKKLVERADCIICHIERESGGAYEAVKYGKKNNVPVIIDIRDLWPDIFNHNLPKILSIVASPYIKYMDIKTKYIMKNCYAINGTSSDILDWGLKKANRKKRKYDRYFYIGYNNTVTKDNNDFKKCLINPKKFNISFFATINNQFNYNLIYELASMMNEKDSDVVFNICGDGPQFDLLKNKVKNLENVKLFGWTEKKDLQNILFNSKIGFAPYKDTFDFQMSVSNKFAEYIAYGLPVIITCEGNMKKILEKNNCGIGSQNIKEICEYILKVKNDKKEYKVESDNAKKLYEREFVASKIYDEITEYLEKLGDEK